ncbi:DUF2809 domain-containing protein [Sphingomonas sp. LB-2]|nr:DUF2809 domain-containing protein [Sphingomonas caeni]
MALFAVEVLIALFVRDRFVRPYLGDVLAVILVYLGLRAVLRIEVMPALVVALAIAFAVEFGQLIGILDMLGLRSNAVARIVLGSGFEVKDLLAYLAGAAIVLAAERLR